MVARGVFILQYHFLMFPNNNPLSTPLPPDDMTCCQRSEQTHSVTPLLLLRRRRLENDEKTSAEMAGEHGWTWKGMPAVWYIDAGRIASTCWTGRPLDVERRDAKNCSSVYWPIIVPILELRKRAISLGYSFLLLRVALISGMGN